MAPTKKETDATAKNGVNYVRTVVEKANSIFHPVHTENDFGVDAIIELVDGTDVRGICIAVQIKSGASYRTSRGYVIPATEDHLNYWERHSLRVVGVVFDPREENAFWVDITHRLRHEREKIARAHAIRFGVDGVNALDDDGFRTFFRPMYLGQRIALPFERAHQFAVSPSDTQHWFGMQALLYGHASRVDTWDILISLLEGRPADKIHPFLAHALARIPGHADIFWAPSEVLPMDVRTYAAAKLKEIDQESLAKLLALAGGDDFQRGGVGQSVEAVVSLLPGKLERLSSLLSDRTQAEGVRSTALVLFAYYDPGEAIGILGKYTSDDILGVISTMLLNSIQEQGEVYLF